MVTKPNEASAKFVEAIKQLEETFSDGRIPSGADYTRFLELIKFIGQAVGLIDESGAMQAGDGLATDGPGKPLRINKGDAIQTQSGKVAVDYDSSHGLGLTQGTKLGVMADESQGLGFASGKLIIKNRQEGGSPKSGLAIDNSGLTINCGENVKITSDNKLTVNMPSEVKFDEKRGLNKDSNGAYIEISGDNSALKFDDGGNLSVKCHTDSCLKIDKDGLRVNCGAELGGGSDPITVNCGDGIAIEGGKIKVSLGRGLKFINGRITVDNIDIMSLYPKGTVMLWYKDLAPVPSGWDLVHPDRHCIIDVDKGNQSFSSATFRGFGAYIKKIE